MEAEVIREGRYILTTNDPHVSREEAVAHYKELSDIEAGFRELKDVIRGRPIHHQRDDRICAHIFIAQLALLLLRELRHRLNEKEIPLSPREAIAALKSLGIAELDLNGTKQVLVSSPKRDARRVLGALGITDLQPPGSVRKKGSARIREKAPGMTN